MLPIIVPLTLGSLFLLGLILWTAARFLDYAESARDADAPPDSD